MSVDPTMTEVLKNVESEVTKFAPPRLRANAGDSLEAIQQDFIKNFTALAMDYERRINAYLEGFRLDRDTVLRKAG